MKLSDKWIRPLLIAVMALGSLAGCTDEETLADDDGVVELHPLFACVEEEFAVGKPLVGEGYDPAQGGLINPTQETYFIHTTQLFVRPGEDEAFFKYVGPIIAQLQDTPGLIAFSLAGDAACGDNRTMGIWESEEAIFNFMVSGAHAEAMPKTSEVSEAARTVRWEATVAEVNALTWDVAKEKIAKIPQSNAF